ncbi:hypothetical protein [Pendulispora albinea]|uniref:Uncharacterized protein n=1 Tax=Pendulispora albinea TaxID=2741071 RepID=A0ABZ2LMP8_9BACT
MSVFWGTKRALFGPLGVWRYRDVLLSVLDDASWTAFARRLSLGLLAETIAAREGIEPDRESVRAAAEAHRRQERLLTVEELEEWLGSQDLPVEEWHRYIVRGVLRSQLGPALVGCEQDLSSTGRFGDAFFAEALCSRFLPRARDAFTEKLVLAAEGGPLRVAPAPDAPDILQRYPWLREVPEERLSHVRAVLVLAQTRLALATTDLRVRGTIEQRRLDWTRLSCDVFLTSEQAIAREIAACLRQEGEPFVRRAAHLPGLVHQARAFLLEETPAPLRAAMVSACPAAIVGPWPEGERYAVYWVRERHAPRDDDPEIWARGVACVQRSILKAAGARARAEDRALRG